MAGTDDVETLPAGLIGAIEVGTTTAEALVTLLAGETGATLVGDTLLALGMIGLTTVGALTAVVPFIVAPETFVRGATANAVAGGAAAATGLATAGLLPADALPPLLAAPNTRARTRPMMARQSRSKHNHHGQPPFPLSFYPAGGGCR